MCAGIGIAAAVASVMAVRRLPWVVGIRFGLCTACGCGTSIYAAASYICNGGVVIWHGRWRLTFVFKQSTSTLGVICFTIGHSLHTVQPELNRHSKIPQTVQ